MSQPTYNHQTITLYLLGALPAAEKERLDELSFSDNEFADSLRAAEKDLLDAYVQGELAGNELEQFKAFYLASPLRREKVEFAQAFQGWSEKKATAQAERVKLERREKHRKAGWFSGLSGFSQRLRWQWGFAAVAVILLLAGGLLVFQNLRLRQQMTQTQAKHDELRQREQKLLRESEVQRPTNSSTEQELARLRDERERLEQELKRAQGRAKPSLPGKGIILAVTLAPPLRDAGQLPTVSMKIGTSVVKMQLQLEAADYSAYRVALIDPANDQVLWRSGSLKPRISRERKAIVASFSAGLLKRQNYTLRVAGIPGRGGSEIVSDYSFKVVK